MVADAAMISTENTQALKENGINYIVGARLGNLADALIGQIDKSITREDGNSIRITTDNGYLICSYSSVRYRRISTKWKSKLKRQNTSLTTHLKTKD